MGRLIGLSGGTFDPPHVGHLALAEAGRLALDLGEVRWIVTADPPHKPGWPITPMEHRLAMVTLLLFGKNGHSISRVEVDRPGSH